MDARDWLHTLTCVAFYTSQQHDDNSVVCFAKIIKLKLLLFLLLEIYIFLFDLGSKCPLLTGNIPGQLGSN
jgi:hypothetical protein